MVRRRPGMSIPGRCCIATSDLGPPTDLRCGRSARQRGPDGSRIRVCRQGQVPALSSPWLAGPVVLTVGDQADTAVVEPATEQEQHTADDVLTRQEGIDGSLVGETLQVEQVRDRCDREEDGPCHEG